MIFSCGIQCRGFPLSLHTEHTHFGPQFLHFNFTLSQQEEEGTDAVDGDGGDGIVAGDVGGAAEKTDSERKQDDDEEVVDIDLEDPEVAAAATKIQGCNSIDIRNLRHNLRCP